MFSFYWKTGKAAWGFTLAELLIALLIIGEIAAFTIPKILYASQNQQYNAEAHQVAGMIAAAYQQAWLSGAVTSSTRLKDLTPYFNYIAVYTGGVTIDDMVGFGSLGCSSAARCYSLHSGGILMDREGFAAANSTNAMIIHFDADGNYSGITNGSGKSIMFLLFYTGQVTSRAQDSISFQSTGGTWGASTTADPPWFQW